MPIVYQQNINDFTKLALWKIDEDEIFFQQVLNIESPVRHPQKRLQYLAGRHLLKFLFPDFPMDNILISTAKKPYLESNELQFSISHCKNYAAAILSTKSRVGIDIEIVTDKVLLVRHKFLTQKETKIIENWGLTEVEATTIAWSIKEAMYKWDGFGGIDFKENLKICDVKKEAGKFIADCVFNKEQIIKLRLEAMFINNIFLVWLAS